MPSNVENGLLVWVPIVLVSVSFGLGLWALLDIVLRPESAFRSLGVSQTSWIVRLVLLFFICAPVSLPFSAYYLLKLRPRLRDVTLAAPPPTIG
jgi:hypothetical protein